MTEAAITKQILAYLKAEGWYTWKVHGGPLQKSGMPDIMTVKDGRTMWLEVKRPGGRITRLQFYRMEELREAGHEGWFVKSLEECQDVIEVKP